jgi:N-acylneuraminate cytidylyltransferase
MSVGRAACDLVVLSSDIVESSQGGGTLKRPAELCQPDTPMIEVVKHALAHMPGEDDQIIVLLQPTSPLRTVETVKQAIQMLEDGGEFTHSIVSVSPSYPKAWTLDVLEHGLIRCSDEGYWNLGEMPTRRQDCTPSYKRDGVVYAFRRSTIDECRPQSIYGWQSYALHTPPAESLSIDTPEDWDEAVRRLRAAAATGSPTAR